MKKINLLLCISLLFNVNAYNQKNSIIPVWSSKLNSLHAIIENKGVEKDINERKILYSYYGSKEKFFFTNKGLIIRIDTCIYKKGLASAFYSITGNQKEANENIKIIWDSYYIYAEWKNSSSQMLIEHSSSTNGYYTFRSSKEKCLGFSKIIYRNIYPNIDIEYILPNDSSGIEYNIILHEGANLSDVQLVYSGDVKKMNTDNSGNIIITTPIHNIIEHAPKSFEKMSRKNISTSFVLNNNTISFNVLEESLNKEIVIDPWVSGINISGDDYGFDVEYDYNQNLYVYTRAHSANALYVSKFSNTGTLLWTHTITTQTLYEGNFMLDSLSKKIYIVDGYNANGSYAYRIDLNGTPDGFTTQQNSNLREMWDMIFNYKLNIIIGFGGGTNSNINGGIIDSVTGEVSFSNFTGLSSTCQDIVSEAVDNFGNVFVCFANAQGYCEHYLDLLNPYLNGHVWQVIHGMYGFQECSNHPPDYSCMGPGSNAFNALAVNNNYLFFYDGQGLAAFNKTNGNRIAAISVGYSGIWYLPIAQGGIAVDDCNNIYVGGTNNNLLVYTFQDTIFNGPVNVPLNWPGTFVWDIKFDKYNNSLFVSGYNGICVLHAAQSDSCFSVLPNVSMDNQLLIYPNPANSYVNINWEKINTKAHVKIFNMLSQLMIEKDISKNEAISVQFLPVGIYVLEINFGDVTIQKELIISR